MVACLWWGMAMVMVGMAFGVALWYGGNGSMLMVIGGLDQYIYLFFFSFCVFRNFPFVVFSFLCIFLSTTLLGHLDFMIRFKY